MPSLVILVSAVFVLSCGQTDTHINARITDAAKRFTPASVVSVSNETRYLRYANLQEPKILTGIEPKADDDDEYNDADAKKRIH